MDHHRSVESRAAERYLIEEMSEAERFAFEEHYFDCAECAEDVRLGSRLIRGIRDVNAVEQPGKTTTIDSGRKTTKSGRPPWFNRASIIPSAIAATLACVVIYQSSVMDPAGREGDPRARTVAPVVLRAATRGDLPRVSLSPQVPWSVLWLDVNNAEPGQPLRYSITRADGESISGDAQGPPAGAPLLVVVRNDQMSAGDWAITIRNAAGAELGQYRFAVVKP